MQLELTDAAKAKARSARELIGWGFEHGRSGSMKLSTDRILTTHVGSLPRPNDLFELMLARMDGKPVDETTYAAHVREAVASSVRQQAATGLDIVSDGEMGKPSFITYAAQRLSGLEQRAGSRPSPFADTRETRAARARRGAAPHK